MGYKGHKGGEVCQRGCQFGGAAVWSLPVILQKVVSTLQGGPLRIENPSNLKSLNRWVPMGGFYSDTVANAGAVNKADLGFMGFGCQTPGNGLGVPTFTRIFPANPLMRRFPTPFVKFFRWRPADVDVV